VGSLGVTRNKVNDQRKMTPLDEVMLRRLLREHIAEAFDIVQIEEFEDEFDDQGRAIPHRDSYRSRNIGRLERLREVVPDRTDLHDRHVAVIRLLDVMEPNERLYHWVARSKTREYSGASTLGYIVSFYSYSLPSSADKQNT
jgi:hypothetical protein